MFKKKIKKQRFLKNEKKDNNNKKVYVENWKKIGLSSFDVKKAYISSHKNPSVSGLFVVIMYSGVSSHIP